ncbi:type II secretion system protein N [Parvularcula sp. LCG005]|uniref:type II secretion system protein N n=1 Tax=Parvularcula sp. LCG005 TaxID=3078805 RepID=UPI0029437587|nr:type II secretion system protein N [Parvularcula sp. LCG005]WOI54366.1 type II secretion system protein N [Parvularcula sp. LCG005]
MTVKPQKFERKGPGLAEIATTSTSQAPDSEGSAIKATRRQRESAFDSALAIRLVEGCYVALLGFLTIQLIFTLFEPLTIPSGRTFARGDQPIADLTVMSSFDPFIGYAPQTTEVEDYTPAAETMLNIKLVGTYVIGDEPSATIATESNGQRLFFVGDTISSGVTVRDILSDQVILNRNGITETLSLENRAPVARQTSSGPRTAPTPGSTGSRPPAGDSVLSSYVQVGPAPGTQGLVLSAGTNPMFFEAAGLIDGDILLNINGQPVSSNPAQVMGSMATMLSRGPVTATISRHGEEFDIVLDPSGLLP